MSDTREEAGQPVTEHVRSEAAPAETAATETQAPETAAERPMVTRRLRKVNAPLSPPWSEQGLLEVFRHRYILSLLVRREITARYQGSVLGLLWSYVNPLTQFFIYYFVMGILFGRAGRVEDFAVHVFAGLIVVHFFTETMNAGTRSIVRNKSLVQKMAVPREMFPVASMLVSLFHVGPQVLILLIATKLSGWSPDPMGLLYGLFGLVISMTLGTALALMFSAANVFMRDISNAVNVLSNFVRFGVPMMYPYSLVATRFHHHTAIYNANPIVEAVLSFQRCFWVGATHNPAHTAATFMPPGMLWLCVRAVLICLVVLAIAQSTFSRLERRIPERLL